MVLKNYLEQKVMLKLIIKIKICIIHRQHARRKIIGAMASTMELFGSSTASHTYMKTVKAPISHWCMRCGLRTYQVLEATSGLRVGCGISVKHRGACRQITRQRSIWLDSWHCCLVTVGLAAVIYCLVLLLLSTILTVLDLNIIFNKKKALFSALPAV